MEKMSSFFNIDPVVRLLHFEKLCRRKKTVEAFTEEELRTIQRFLYFNVNVSTQGFRQRLLTCIKYVLVQLKGSGYALWREKNDGVNNGIMDGSAEMDRLLKLYEDFVHWLVKFCFYCLHLRACYSRRAAALSILDLFYNSGILEDSQRRPYISTWDLDDCWARDNVNALLLTLADTYETNQLLALKLLNIVPDRYLSPEDCSTFLDVALDWCRTSKTQQAETAVYYFLLAINRCDIPMQLCNTGEEEGCNSIDLRDSRWSKKERNCFLLCRSLIRLLKRSTDTAEADLIHAAMEEPPWGLLRSSLSIMKEVDWSPVLNSHVEAVVLWRNNVHQLLHLCQRLTKIASPIVNSACPEGYLPPDTTSDHLDSSGTAYGVSLENSVSDNGHSATSQAVLVCSWRTQKEVSAIFGFLASSVGLRSLLSLDDLVSIGDYFLVQLTECKHRGAFECAYASFLDICSSLGKSSNEKERELPKKWLGKIIDGLGYLSDGGIGGNNGANYCATRRSAGVPFLVQAVMATEPKTASGRGSTLFYDTLHKLLRITFEEQRAGDDDHATAKVHSLNIIRALLKESKLGLSCLTPPWLSLIAQGDLLLFTDRSWAVRNSATLLFSAWMVRVFGVPRKRHEISSKNRIASSDFESLCPGLLDFMLHLLRTYVEGRSKCSTTRYQEMFLFPILSILSHLRLCSRHNTNTVAFIPYVLHTLLECPIISVRRSAASALCSILEESAMKEVMGKLIGMVHDGREIGQNALNGLLLLIERQLHVDGIETLPKLLSLFSSSNLGYFNLAALMKLAISNGAFNGPGPLDVVITDMLSCSSFERYLTYPILASLVLMRTIAKEKEQSDSILDLFRTDELFRCELYKQWRKMFKNSGSHKTSLISLAEQLSKTGLVWRDVIGSHNNLKLRKEATKFCLSFNHPPIDQHEKEISRSLLNLYQDSSQGLVRRRLLQLACRHYHACDGDIEMNTSLVRELDNASKPERPSDDRRAVVNCLAELDAEVMESNRIPITVMLIRLLTDPEEVIRDEAAIMWSTKFSLQSAIQPGLVLFMRVFQLISMDPVGEGKRAFCNFLLEIANEFARAMEYNSAGGRIFEKNESNYNCEALLLGEWLRLATSGRLADSLRCSPPLDILHSIDQCLSMDALKSCELSLSSPNQSKDLVCFQFLSLLVAHSLGGNA